MTETFGVFFRFALIVVPALAVMTSAMAITLMVLMGWWSSSQPKKPAKTGSREQRIPNMAEGRRRNAAISKE